jgi:hypothetical protein
MTAYEIATALDTIGSYCDAKEWGESPMAKAAAMLRQQQMQLDEIQKIANKYESDYVRSIKLASVCGEQG